MNARMVAGRCDNKTYRLVIDMILFHVFGVHSNADVDSCR